MSGFFGIFRTDGRQIEDRSLKAVAQQMAFRGLDGSNLWRQDNIGSCFALMKTGPVEQAPQQPVTWGDRLKAVESQYSFQ